jgi:hypothetical protein
VKKVSKQSTAQNMKEAQIEILLNPTTLAGIPRITGA